MFVERVKEKFDANTPIFTYEILELFPEYTKAYVFRLINKAERERQIEKFCKGVYFLPSMTPSGLSTITVEDVIYKKYIANEDDVYGIISGLGLENGFCLSDKPTHDIEIITNNEATRRRVIQIKDRKVILKKSRSKINKDNCYAYTIMQLMSQFDEKKHSYEGVKKVIDEYMATYNIDKNEVLSMSTSFSVKAIKNFINCEKAANINTKQQ